MNRLALFSGSSLLIATAAFGWWDDQPQARLSVVRPGLVNSALAVNVGTHPTNTAYAGSEQFVLQNGCAVSNTSTVAGGLVVKAKGNPVVPISNNWVLSTWILNKLPEANNYVFSQYIGSSGGRSLLFEQATNSYQMFKGSAVVTVTPAKRSDRWMHLCLIVRGTNAAFAIDGSVMTNGAWSATAMNDANFGYLALVADTATNGTANTQFIGAGGRCEVYAVATGESDSDVARRIYYEQAGDYLSVY